MTTLRIVYVEDNDDLRESIAAMLEADDREIRCCSTAEEALTAMAAQECDVLITDVSLPGITGTELARRVTAEKPAQWVVLCSGYEFSHGLKTLGANVRALTKPFEMEAMEALLDEIALALAKT